MRVVAPILLAAAVLLLVAACGGGEVVEAQPETVQGTVATETTAGGEQGGGEQGGGEQGGGQQGGGEQGGEQGDAGAGKQVFTSAGCGSCHTLSDAGTSGAVGPNLDEAKPEYELVVDRVTHGMDGMPSFKGQLSEKQIQDVAAYVSSAAGT